jgi:hypothetical protein
MVAEVGPLVMSDEKPTRRRPSATRPGGPSPYFRANFMTASVWLWTCSFS